MDGSVDAPDEDKPIRVLVAECCHELAFVDLRAYLAICDKIDQNPIGNGTEAVKAIYKELDCRNPSKQLLALKLLETCMKNSSPQLTTLVAQKKMMNLMAEHATGKKNSGGWLARCIPQDPTTQREKSEVKELALVLVRTWAQAFGPRQTEVPLFSATYLKLQQAGVSFPELDPEDLNAYHAAPPPVIPQEAANHTAAAWPLDQPMGGVQGGPQQTVVMGNAVGAAAVPPELALPDLQDVEVQTNLLKEILGGLEPGADISQMDFVTELAGGVRSAQARIQDNAGQVNDEATLMQLVATVELIEGALEMLATLEAAAP